MKNVVFLWIIDHNYCLIKENNELYVLSFKPYAILIDRIYIIWKLNTYMFIYNLFLYNKLKKINDEVVNQIQISLKSKS